MTPRIDLATAPNAYRALLAFSRHAQDAELEPGLLELVKLRASYMNGCAYCVDMHTKDARAAGESEQRLYAVPVWRETPFFTPRERAALEWTEAVTRLGPEGVSDAVYADVSAHFAPAELVALTMAVIAINMWNRVAVPFRAPVGTYEPAAAASRLASAGR